MPKTKADTTGTPATADTTSALTELTSKERRLLQRTSRFLIAIAVPARARRAAREGYTPQEHKEGWRHWRLAAGEQIGLDHWLDDLHASEDPAHGETLRLLREIDAFENKWFPRMRSVIRRVVPRDQRDDFEAVFFKDLAQQPLGPGVVTSVSTFLQRHGELPNSKLPAAKKVVATLAARGLTAAAIAQVRALLDQFQRAPAPGGDPAARSAARHEASRQQREALESLGDWFNDWFTTLRPVFSGTDAVALGLAPARRGRKAAEEDEDEGEEDEENPSPA